MSRIIISIVMLIAACASTEAPSAPAAKTAPAPATEPSAPVANGDAKVPVPPGVDKPRLPCTAEIDIQCLDGYEDGCIGGRTTMIVCVKKGLTATVPCDRQIMHGCPVGEINSCFANPPYGDNHICVKP
jgi:hypothetical protein